MASTVLVLVVLASARLVQPSSNPANPWGHGELASTTLQLLGSVTFLNGVFTPQIGVNAPLWSLAYEVWYYLMAGLLFRLPGRRGITAAAVVLLLFGFVNHRFALFSVVWFAGFLLALAHDRGYRRTNITRGLGMLALVGAAVFAWLYVRSGLVASSPAQLNARAQILYNVCIGLAFSALLQEILVGSLSFPAGARSTAAYSYTLYITHYPILLLTAVAAEHRIANSVPLALLVAVTAAGACWIFARVLARWVENKHLLRVSHPLRPPRAHAE